MGNTPRLSLPYPELTESPNGPTQIKALAEALEGRVPTYVANTAARDILEAAFVPSATKPLIVFRADAGAGKEIEYTFDGSTWYTVDAQVTTAWTAPTFTNSWVNYGSGYQSARYRKVGDIVSLDGLIKDGDDLSSAFTLPVGFRPLATVEFVGVNNLAGSYIDIQTNGNVYVSKGGGTYASLSGLHFSVTA